MTKVIKKQKVTKRTVPFVTLQAFARYSTFITADSVVALNAGAYKHCITAFPTVKWPAFCSFTSYSIT